MLVDLAATYADYGRVEEEPVHLQLRSARQDTACGAEPIICLPVMPFNTWQMVKRHIKERWPGLKAVPDSNIRLLYKSVELRNGSMVDDYNMQGGTPEHPVELQYLVIDQGHTQACQGDSSIGLYVDVQVPCTREMRGRVHVCLAALLRGIQPRLTEDGTGATYMLKDTQNRQILAVLKPKDEEAFAPQNPRDYVGQENSPGLRQGVYSTQQAAREVAAYLLDHDKFAGVPETTLVHARHPRFVKVKNKVVWKVCAFQSFVDVKDTAGNFAPQVFQVPSVQRIGILDIRIVNLDRNDGNLLVRHARGRDSTRYELVPIDHGLSLPDRLEVYSDDVAWMSYPQAQEPFGEKELAYIKGLNGSSDARLLSKHLGIRRECLRLMEVTTKLLQIGAEHGLTLYDIGTMLFRIDRGSDAPVIFSPLEQIIQNSLDIALAITGVDGGTGSALLSGLDLHTTSLSLGQSHQRLMMRQCSAGGPDRGENQKDAQSRVPLTPQLGPAPSSPFSSPLSNSPHSMEMPPHLSLDGLSSSEEHANLDAYGSENITKFKTAGTDVAASESAAVAVSKGYGGGYPPQAQAPGAAGRGGTDKLKPSEAQAQAHPPSAARKHGASYKAGGTRLRQRGSTGLHQHHREREGQDAQGGSIFSRPNLSASDWSPELEKLFKRHVTAALLEHIRKKFSKTSWRDIVEPVTELGPGQHDTSLASALPSVLAPADTDWLAAYMGEPMQNEETEPVPILAASLPAKKMYVPPHLRRAAADQACDSSDAAAAAVSTENACPEPACTDAADPAVDPPGNAASGAAVPATEEMIDGLRPATTGTKKYVPPFLRRKMEAEAAAAAAAASGDSAAPQAASSTATAAEAEGLPTHASGGNDRYGFAVDQGPRKYMEDAIDATERLDCVIPTEFYAVYDGHSGQQAVEFVRKRLPKVICSHSAVAEPGCIHNVLKDAFHTTDEELLEHLRAHKSETQPSQMAKPPEEEHVAKSQGEEDNSSETGSMGLLTLAASGKCASVCEMAENNYVLSSGVVTCIALLRDRLLHVANLGDCRAVLCVGGEMRQLTVDHNIQGNDEERDRLLSCGCEVSSDGYLHGRIGVSRALGDWAWNADEKCRGLLCSPDVFEFELSEDAEFLLLACDGIFEKLSTKEAGQIVRRSLRVGTAGGRGAAEKLVKHASKLDGTDNLSALVVVLKAPPKDEQQQRTAPRLFGRGRGRISLAELEAAAPEAESLATQVPAEPLPETDLK